MKLKWKTQFVSVSMFVSFLAVLALTLASCSTSKHKPDENAESDADIEASEVVEENSDQVLAELPTREVPSNEILNSVQKPYVSKYGEVALDENKYVDMWLRYFQGRGRPYMVSYLERSSRYLPMMKLVLREYGLPENLVYVALIESGFSPKAHSKANAVGYWQFISETGRRYGLKLDGYIDERRDFVQSTRAAAEYFKTLYEMLGSWHLSLAAYNTGENRVKRLVARRYTKDFWKLIQGRGLPRETKHYVPKFIAATLIAKNPSRYGFTEIQAAPPLAYETVVLTHPISIGKMAAELKTDEEELRLLNPKFRTDYVPLYQGKETVFRLPVGHAKKAGEVMLLAKVDVPPPVKADYAYYRVRSGDTLSHIAKKFRTRVGVIKRLNEMGSRTFLRVGQRIRVPDRGVAGVEPAYLGAAQTKPAIQQSGATEILPVALATGQSAVPYHIVQRGDNLTSIAEKYSTSIDEIRRLNNLRRRAVLRIGQRLLVREQKDPNQEQGTSGRAKPLKKRQVVKVKESLVTPKARQTQAGATWHTVERGETLTHIARIYGLSLPELSQLNRMPRRTQVMVGQKLKIAKSAKIHVVRRGETLGLISAKYKVPIAGLLAINDIEKRSDIQAGQQLRIPRF